MSRFLWFTVYL